MTNSPPPRLVPDRPSDAAIAQALCSSLAIDYENLPDFVLAHAREIDAAAPPAEAPAERGDDFEGDNAHLIECIDALVSLNDSGALVPHGIGGHARKLLLAAASRLAAAPAGEVALNAEYTRGRNDGWEAAKAAPAAPAEGHRSCDLFVNNVRAALGRHADEEAGLICSIALLVAENDKQAPRVMQEQP